MQPRSHTLTFEADESGGAVDLEDDPTVADVVNAVGTDDEPAFDYDDPDFQAAVERATEKQLTARLEALAGEQDDEALDVDPGIQQYLERLAERVVEKRIGPIEPTVKAFEDQRHEQLVETWTDKVDSVKAAAEKMGEFAEGRDPRSSVQYMASGYLPDLEDRYGQGERAIQTSLRMAGEQYHGDIDAAFKAGYAARNAELTGRTSAREPAPANVEGVEIREEPDSVMGAAEIWAARNGLE